jgi:hypothetical protein
MPDRTPFALAKMFTQLTGRNVNFANTADLPTAGSVVYGEYAVKPDDGPLVVKADLALIASFGGALLGLPKETVLERAKQTPIEEGLRDAMHEVLNVASTPLSPSHRAVFQNFHTDQVYCSDRARDLLANPIRTDRFQVTVDGYAGGLFAVYSDV